MARFAREAASKQSDPKEAESLLRSAELIEEADRAILKAGADLLAAVEQSKRDMESIRRRDHLPTWVVVAVLVSFLVFLVFIAIKHYA